MCISNTTTLHVHHAFLCISLLSLYYYDLEMSIFTFFARGGRQHSTFFSFPELRYSLLEFEDLNETELIDF